MQFLIEASGPPVTDAPSPHWLFEQLRDWVNRSPARVAFVVDHESQPEEYTYSDVLKSADAIAAELTHRSIGRGDRVGILMENVPQWVFALLGSMRIGAVTVPLPTTLPENSIRLIAEHAGCRLIFADDANWDKAVCVGGILKC